MAFNDDGIPLILAQKHYGPPRFVRSRKSDTSPSCVLPM